MIPNIIALEEYLNPIKDIINDHTVSEILINQEKIVFVEKKSIFEQVTVENMDYRHLMGLATLVARHSDQRLSEKEPLLSGQLPTGHRIQVILPPATAPNRLVIAIRKQTIEDISLDYYQDLRKALIL